MYGHTQIPWQTQAASRLTTHKTLPLSDSHMHSCCLQKLTMLMKVWRGCRRQDERNKWVCQVCCNHNHAFWLMYGDYFNNHSWTTALRLQHPSAQPPLVVKIYDQFDDPYSSNIFAQLALTVVIESCPGGKKLAIWGACEGGRSSSMGCMWLIVSTSCEL